MTGVESTVQMLPRPHRLLAAALSLAALAGAPTAAAATETVPGEVVVKRAGEAPRVLTGVDDVRATIRRLERDEDVVYATANPVARAAAFVPDDRGSGSGWQEHQWNFAGPHGVNAPQAWQHLIDAGAPGGRGVTVAVLDTGVAYSDRGPFRRSPDLDRTRFTRGYDFVDRDPYPNDENGHGTHVASTVAESTDNGFGLTGLAYGVTILPMRVLDERGEGDAGTIAQAVRAAVRRRVDVINLSLEFGTAVRADEIRVLLEALGEARRRGVLVVGAAGNEGDPRLAFPAKSSHVLAVGATTEGGCLSDFSNVGRGLDLVAPGGGAVSPLAREEPGCQPGRSGGRPILQVSFTSERQIRSFGLPTFYEGTSMAAPHVTATAALVIASRVLGRRPTVAQLVAHLKATARDLGPPGFDDHYGAGLLDAAAATDPARAGAARRRR
jgi:serine protease